MNPLDQFKATISGGQAVAPSASPLGSFPELANYYAAASKLPQVSAGIGALSKTAGVQYGNQLQDEEFNRQTKIGDLKDKAAQMKDLASHPEKYYTQKLKPDGGYDFTDPTGQKISVQEYAQAVGKQPSQVLSKSENSLDKQYLQDHKYTEDVVNAIYNNNGKFFTDLQKSDPEEFNALKKLISDSGDNEKAVQNILERFKGLYPNVYSPQSGKSGNVRAPQKNVTDALQGGGGNPFTDFMKTLGGKIFG